MRVLYSLFCLAFLFGTAFASEGAHHEVSLKMEIFRIINFLIFAWLLYKFAGNAIKNYFKERRENIARSIEEAKKSREEAEKRYNEAKAKVANLEKEVQAIIATLRGKRKSR